jgi:hypothetical protein
MANNHKATPPPPTTPPATPAALPTDSKAWQQAIAGIESEITRLEARRSELVAERAGLRLRARFGFNNAQSRITAIDQELEKLSANLADAVTDAAGAKQHLSACLSSEAEANEDSKWLRIAELYATRDTYAAEADAALAEAATAIQAARALQSEIQSLLPSGMRDNFALGKMPATLALAHYGFDQFSELAPLGPSYAHRSPYTATLRAWTRTKPPAAAEPVPASAVSPAWMAEADARNQARPRAV